MNVDLKVENRRARFSQQKTPMHDFLDFKNMTGNEILINLQHEKMMTTSERLNALLALYNRDRYLEYPWTSHPWFMSALDTWKGKILFSSHKHCLIGIIMAHKF
jgi:hypothetical protein